MKTIAIKAENLSKEYRIYKSNRQRMAFSLFGRNKGKAFKAVDDVSFEIEKGEKVAVLGNIGAGKTTLVKMLAGITTPTSGSLEMNGRVSSIFDLRAGFDWELTGRDNIMLKGTVLGWNKKETAAREQEIIEFAELEKIIDQPLKTFISGEAGRLGFAMCTAVKPEILLMDEGFSVGDEVFRLKCRDRLKNLIEGDDVTFVLVSNSVPVMKDLCDRCIVLDEGKIRFDGDVLEAVKYYKANCKRVAEETQTETKPKNRDNDDEADDSGSFAGM